jgi:signal peptide peptidase SppA
MRLIDIVRAPWAVTPEMYAEVQGIYARHCRGEKIDLSALEARLGQPLANTRHELDIRKGVAVITLDGVLAKRANLFMKISGGTSTQIVGQQLRQALDDPYVSTIVLHVDSPGGTVDGTQELADQVFAADQKKAVIAVADGMMASAAYWIGGAARRVFMTSDVALVGSIGVVATHQDWSGWESKAGVRTTEITAGKYKRIASEYAPLSEEGRAAIQAEVDAIYTVFVDQVARHRGADVDTVLADMADGRVFVGKAAIDAGLVDGVSTLEQVIARAAAGEFAGAPRPTRPKKAASAGVAEAADETPPATEQENSQMLTLEQVRADHPEIAQALIAEGHATGRAEGVAAGGAAERERIRDVEAQAEPGFESLIGEMKYDGKSTGGDAARAILAAGKARRAERLDALRSDAEGATTAPAVAPSADPTPPKPKDAKALAAAATAYMAEQAAKGVKVRVEQAVAHVSSQA